MNSLAQQALASALGKVLPAPTGKPQQTRAATEVPAAYGPVPLPQIVITGPINRVMELEGKRFALEFVRGAWRFHPTGARQDQGHCGPDQIRRRAAIQRGQRREDCY